MNLLDVFGKGGSGKKFYMRDFKNGYRNRPDVNPPRQKFNGYVNFIFNRNLYNYLYNDVGNGNNEFRTTLSTQIRTADLPSVQFKTETIPQYNKKKIVNTGVEYDPVTITVMDTVGNEWLTLIMKYFAYHYMNPRNKSGEGREVDINAGGIGGKDVAGSQFGTDKFNSNAAGYNPNLTPYFFERIDYVLYHGNKGVQYSLINPVLTGFKSNSIDYASSDILDFQLTFVYESFTIHNDTNFQLGNEDLDRFENVSNISGAVWGEDNGTPLRDTVLKERTLDFLGSEASARPRAGQLDANEMNKTITEYTPTTLPVYNKSNSSVLASQVSSSGDGFTGSILDNVLTDGLNNIVNGKSPLKPSDDTKGQILSKVLGKAGKWGI